MKKRFIRFDSVGGASGDMILAALAALGADLKAIETKLREFFPESLHFHTETVSQSGVCGMHLTVHAHAHHQDEAQWQEAGDVHTHGHTHAHAHHHHRSYAEIRSLIESAPLSDWVRSNALSVFSTIADAEGKIHGKSPEEVHFHEVGAWDSVADIIGAILAMEQLGISGISCGPLPSGVGTIHCAHGEMPNPAPATQLLLAGMSILQTEEPFELVTPTGAALLNTLSHQLQPVPATTVVLRAGIGFGTRVLTNRPNLLRATLLEGTEENPAHENPLLVMETNVDDASPEWLGALLPNLLQNGALDVWCTPILMKKGRPAATLSVLAKADDAARLREQIFRETGTFGIRFYPVEREILDRHLETRQTPWGPVGMKIGLLRGEPIAEAPEFEDCRAVAEKAGIPLRNVYDAAKRSGK